MDRAGATMVARQLVDHVERVIRGKRAVVEAAATALFAGGAPADRGRSRRR
ncbi:MAG: hypothetical protein ABR529_15670 [Actinomycetota bacterium]